jgi:uncharacterized damage-inducible protein DinB
MIHFFKELFEYSHHFNQKLATVFTEQPVLSSGKSIQLFNHLLNAQQVWTSRVLGAAQPFGAWEMHPVGELKEIDRANYTNAVRILDESDLNSAIKYTTSKGETYTNSVRDILFHVINHSTYHRGQIATEFKQNGIDPLVTDYIFYKR